jgi:hypothetical protein
MTTRTVGTSPLIWGRVFGLTFLIRFIPAIFGEFFVRSSLVVPGDAATTATNIMASEGLFRAGIASMLIVFILDVVAILALYVVLKPVNRNLSLLAAFFGLIHVAIAGLNLLTDFLALLLLSGADYLTVFETDQLHALVLLLLNSHRYGFQLGLFFFSLHLGILGYLVFKSGYLPRILGVFLIVSSFGYLLDSFALILLPNYADYEEIIIMVLFLPNLIGEMALALWLLFKGVNVEQWEKRALESA